MMTTFARRMIKTSKIFHLFGLIQLFMCFDIIIGICENLPPVQNSRNNATSEEGPFEDGSSIAFSCKSWYRGFGSGIYTCRDGSWVGDYKCLRMCEVIDELENGKIVGNPTYVVGTRVNFTCNSGYELEGHATLLCRADGKWRPSSPPTCKPVDCGEFGNINNGYTFQESLDGIRNDFGSVITIRCDLGYLVQGSNSVTCNADGSWGAKPDCVKSSCGTHPATKTKCVDEINLSDDGSVLTVLCKETSASQSVTEVGLGTAICSDNQWDELDIGCFCDCKVKTDGQGVNIDNLQKNGFLKHGDALKWSCSFGFKKNDTSDIICDDGEIKQPSCVIKWWIWLIVTLSVVAVILISSLVIYFIVKHFKSDNKRDKDTPEEVPLA